MVVGAVLGVPLLIFFLSLTKQTTALKLQKLSKNENISFPLRFELAIKSLSLRYCMELTFRFVAL